MEVLEIKAFHRDIKNIKDEKIQEEIKNIVNNIKLASEITEIRCLKKLKNKKDIYRIKTPVLNKVSFRLIVKYIENSNIVEIVAFLPRKEVYSKKYRDRLRFYTK